MGLKEWIIPQEKRFYDLLSAVSSVVLKGAEDLNDLVHNFKDVTKKRKRLKNVEHQGDQAVHEIFEALNRTFITPIDREDIIGLTTNMDNVLDMIYAASVRLDLYKVDSVTPPTVALAEIILESCRHIDLGMNLIRDRKNWSQVETIAVEINRLENRADDILNEAVADLFNGNDALTVIKLKDIYEKMEMATDYCEDVADRLSDIVVKYR